MEFYIAIWIVAAFVVALFALDKKIGYWNTFLISVLLSPVIGLIVALVSKDKFETANPQSNADELQKLKSLLDSGALSQVEYDQAKKKILDRGF